MSTFRIAPRLFAAAARAQQPYDLVPDSQRQPGVPDGKVTLWPVQPPRPRL